MRAVFDTTVLIDALFVTQSAGAKALREVQRGRLQMITTPAILGEFQGVARGPRFRQSELRAWIMAQGIATMPNVTIVQPADIPRTVPGDAMDDHIVAAAVVAGADIIVSSDHHLLDIKQHRGIRIVTPQEFLVLIGVEKPPVATPSRDGLAA